jgi:predicted nucleic acid-binding protein
MKTKKPRSPTRAQSAPAFWDSSAIIPLCCQQPQSPPARRSARVYDTQIVWWGTSVEIFSGIYRLTHEGGLTVKESQAAVKALESLRHKWNEILPSDEIRQTAERLLRTHPLRAADALQLASALVWCGAYPSGRAFICADIRLSDAADKEGFNVIRL